MPEVELWEAVALVLEIEPTDLKPSKDQWLVGAGKLPVFSSHSFPSQQKQTDFDTALRLAERFTNIAGPIHLRTGLASGMNKRMALVSLSEVVAFFVSRECPDIPPPLLAQVAAKLANMPGHRPPGKDANLHDSVSRADAADMLNVSARTVAAAPKVRSEVPDELVRVDAPNAAAPLQNWKMQIQEEAADHWRTLRKSGANPTVHSIVVRMANWCRENDVRTDGNINPKASYLRTHVLGGKHWTPPG